jgi:ATP-binding cassette subfamily B (MDR/TAP) protein 1
LPKSALDLESENAV